jgi:rubrerythrin
MQNPKKKRELLEEFAEMRALEASAQVFYANVGADQAVDIGEVRAIFKGISEDEQRHVELVDRIIKIIKNNL